MPRLILLATSTTALLLSGVDVPNAKVSMTSRALDDVEYPASWPFDARDLTPEDNSNDQLFYLVPKFVNHAGDECRASLTQYYEAALPPKGTGAVLDLCSSWTSHYPKGYKAKRCAALGLNALELLANPCKTEWAVQNLNVDPTLPYDDDSFDVITNSLSCDYLTSPLEVFQEMRRVLRPGGLAAMAFTNRCFPTKVVPCWTRPFTEPAHARIVASYYHFAGFEDISVADVSPDGWVGQRDPMIVVQARAPGGGYPGEGVF
mmetsp:Transcript_2628/g.7668  ORF Transcript_2628/g.7668 Transcript_2628/m.7668 type:complete len:261 (-) Transcript_2628:10-792(-)